MIAIAGDWLFGLRCEERLRHTLVGRRAAAAHHEAHRARGAPLALPRVEDRVIALCCDRADHGPTEDPPNRRCSITCSG
jgi:hypothetical protein